MKIIRIVSASFIVKNVCWRSPEGDPRNTLGLSLSWIKKSFQNVNRTELATRGVEFEKRVCLLVPCSDYVIGLIVVRSGFGS